MIDEKFRKIFRFSSKNQRKNHHGDAKCPKFSPAAGSKYVFIKKYEQNWSNMVKREAPKKIMGYYYGISARSVEKNYGILLWDIGAKRRKIIMGYANP